MCCFSSAVRLVTDTCIIVGKTPNKTIKIIYCNKVACDNKNIMVLPVQCVPNTVKLVDDFTSTNKDYHNLYKYVDEYRNILSPMTGAWSVTNGDGAQSSYKLNKVEVVQYGSYIVSITDDLTRVDWDAFSNNGAQFCSIMSSLYPAHSFIVAKFTDTSDKPESKTPIAYEFVPINWHNVLIPTLHIHNGNNIERDADWDHNILAVNGTIKEVDERLQCAGTMKHFRNKADKTLIGVINKHYEVESPLKAGDRSDIEITHVMSPFPNKDLKYDYGGKTKAEVKMLSPYDLDRSADRSKSADELDADMDTTRITDENRHETSMTVIMCAAVLLLILALMYMYMSSR